MESTRNLKLIIVALLLLLGFSLYFNPFGIDENTVNTKDLCSDYSNDDVSTLKTGLISDLVERYRKNQLTYINRKMQEMNLDLHSNSDSHAIWFDLDTIKKFIYHIEKNVQTNNMPADTKLGLRIYYGAYPEAENFTRDGYEDLADLANDAEKYSLRHTLIFIPNIYNETIADDVDFNPLDKDTYSGYVSMPKKNSPTAIAPYEAAGYEPMALTPTQRIAAMNHGHLYPPDNLALGF